MLIYSTVSPYYFDYLASCRTRQEILDDPELCKYLENPALKDNMELALAYSDAKKGGYAEKKQFVEYLLCNGPELDADTICYYRDKAYQDPIYLQIAEIEFNDMTIVDQLRIDKYGKSNDLGDCFTKPCNYLGPFSNVIGLMGDANNFRTMPNIFSTLLNGTDEEKKNLSACWGNIRQHMMNKMLPNISTAYAVLYNNMYEHMKQFVDQCKEAGLTKGINIGDRYSIKRADEMSAATKVNVHSQLGDCARVWEHMRRFNPYDISQNKKSPMPDSAIRDNKAANGGSIDNTRSPSFVSQLPPDKLKEAASKGNKIAQAELEVQNLPWPLTLKDLEYAYDSKHTNAEKFKYLENKLNDDTSTITLAKWSEAKAKLQKKYKDDPIALRIIEEQIQEHDKKINQKVINVYNGLMTLRNAVVAYIQKPAEENITDTGLANSTSSNTQETNTQTTDTADKPVST